MSNTKIHQQEELRMLGILGIIAYSYFTINNFKEFLKVGLAHRTRGYDFGEPPLIAWYYRSAQTYSTYSLVLSVISLLMLILIGWGKYKNNRRLIVLPLAVLVVFCCVLIIEMQR